MGVRKVSTVRKAIQLKRSAVFMRTFLLVAGIGVLSLSVMGVLSFRISSRQITNQVAEAARLTLETQVATLEERLSRVDSIALHIAFSEDTLRLASSGMEDVPGRLLARDMIGRLGNFRTTNPWIHSLLVYDVRNGLIVSETVTTIERFDDRTLLERAQSATSKTAFPFRVADGSRVLTLIYPYTFFAGTTTAVVIINLDFTRFFEPVSSHAKESIFRVYGSEGTVHYPEPGALEASTLPRDLEDLRDDQSLLVLEMRSARWPWSYVHAQTYSSIIGAARLVRRLLLGAAILIALLSTLLAHLVASTLYRPLCDLVDHVERLVQRRERTESNEYDVIDTAVEQLATENDRLAEGYRTALSFFRRYSVAELLHSKTWNEDQFQTILRSLNIEFSRSATFVLILESRSGESVDLRNAVESFLVRREDDAASVVAIEAPRRVSVVLNIDDSGQDPAPIVTGLHASLSASGFSVTVSVSDPMRDLNEIPGRYAETKRRLEIGSFFGVDGIVSSRDRTTEPALVDAESSTDRVQKAIESLDREGFRAALDALGAETFGIEPDVIARVRFLFYHAGSRFQDTANRLGVRLEAIGPAHVDLFKKAEALTSSDEMTSVLCSAMDELIGESDRIRGDRRREAVEAALKYMERSYSRDISIEDIAAAVFLSSRYLNALFNEERGVSVHKALTEIRIHHARRLLAEAPHMSVGEIATSVGYRTPHSFMRMFKKQVGVTPVSFRRNIARTVGAHDESTHRSGP